MGGIKQAGVNYGTARATIEYDADKVSPVQVRKVIENIGFEVPLKRESFPIEGMTCASCVSRVENKLRSLHGVVDVQVNLATKKVDAVDPTKRSARRKNQICLRLF